MIISETRWKVVIKDGKINHYKISKAPYQSFDVEDISQVILNSLFDSKHWTITFYHDKQRPVVVTEYYSRKPYSRRRKGFDLLFDLLEDKMLRKDVIEYKKQKNLN